MCCLSLTLPLLSSISVYVPCIYKYALSVFYTSTTFFHLYVCTLYINMRCLLHFHYFLPSLCMYFVYINMRCLSFTLSLLSSTSNPFFIYYTSSMDGLPQTFASGDGASTYWDQKKFIFQKVLTNEL